MRLRTLAFGLIAVCASALAAQSPALIEKSQRARELMGEGKFEQAVPLYRELSAALPGNPGLLLNLGIALHMSHREREAVVQLQKALKLDPGLNPAKLYLGYTYLSLGEPGKAIGPLQDALKADPRDPDLRQNLGEALQAVERLSDAVVQLKEAVALEAQRPSAWYRLGRTYEALAQRTSDELGKAGRDSAWWLALAAESTARSLQYSSAFQLYRAAIAKQPGMRGPHEALANIYQATGHAGWAEVERERERQLPPPDCNAQKLECLFNQARYDEIAADSGTSPEALYWKARAYNSLAIQAFSSLGSFPQSPEMHQLKAEIHTSSRNFAGAAAEWRQAYELSGENPVVGSGLALALTQVQDYKGARQLLETLLAAQPASPGLHYLMGSVLLKLQEPALAVQHLEKAVVREPQHLAAREALGRAYLAAGQSLKAVPHLQAALPLDEDGSLHYQLARAYQATGRRELAAPLLKKYQELHDKKEADLAAAKEEFKITPP